MNNARLLADGIDFISRWTGEKASLLMIPLVCIAILEVVMRYVFDSPTIWAWDVNIQLGAALISLSGAYALLCGLFVRVDIVICRIPAKIRVWVELLVLVVPLFAVGILVKLGVSQAIKSCLGHECLASTWLPPIYPLRIVVASGLILLFLQIISRVIRTFLIILDGDEAMVSSREDNS